YGPAKAAVASLGRSMALELARWQVTANTVAPGPIATELFNQGQPVGTPARIRIETNVPLGRVGDPADIAAATSFFLSDEAGYVTGQTLNVCGGLSVGFGAQ
ncbi:MAG: SDR family oxidoreductase, partial [Pseudomonadota bacterium]|nr:SDR family oxidoreductase [Pseudomonadota bacterium]